MNDYFPYDDDLYDGDRCEWLLDLYELEKCGEMYSMTTIDGRPFTKAVDWAFPDSMVALTQEIPVFERMAFWAKTPDERLHILWDKYRPGEDFEAYYFDESGAR